MSTKYILKDSPQEVIEEAAPEIQPQGRVYDSKCAEKPGGICAEDLVLGMKFAACSITDDKPDTLKDVAVMNPWHLEVMKIITGSEEKAHGKLSDILQECFNLTTDKQIDVSGFQKGKPVDTQGYIAHNDEIIVLAYRCTTTGLDWLTNFSVLTSEWEPEEDIEQGHAGLFSCIDGLFCCNGTGKPRVHTGFYNNFLSAFDDLKEHLLPLLEPDQPPRKLYIVGHSLGAGIATIATCYFLLFHDWVNSPHRLISVTAGAPRTVLNQMRDIIQERMEVLRPLNKAVIARIVLNQDVVATVPPSLIGYSHIDKLVLIADTGEILINPNLKNKQDTNIDSFKGLGDKWKEGQDHLGEEDDDEELTDYEKKLKIIPPPLKDHMPDCYLKPLIALFENEQHNKTTTEEEPEEVV